MKRIYTLIILMLAVTTAWSQSAKTTIGAGAGVEWNTLSGLKTVQAERGLVQRDNWSIGVKAIHAFRYRLSNMELLHSSDEGKVRFTTLAPTFQLNPGGRSFFLQSALGVAARQQVNGDHKTNTIHPSFEAGLGWAFRLGKSAQLKWSASLSFAGRGGITGTSIAIGF